MRVALLSSGPSLSQAWEHAQACGRVFDLTIGVNRAATLYAVDWWSAGDWQVFYELNMVPVGNPHLWTMRPSVDEILRRGRLPWMTGEVRSWADSCAAPGEPQGWSTWSCVAALVLAATLGAKEIEAFGVDMEGDTDCAGERGASRDAGRWSREGRAWQQALVWLGKRDIKVTRNSMKGIEA